MKARARNTAHKAAFDSCPGWVTRFTIDGVHYGGTRTLVDDPRILWMATMLGDVAGKRVLELGPLEGAHSLTLSRLGTKHVDAIEGFEPAFQKCSVIQNLFALRDVTFHHADFRQWLDAYNGPAYDLVVASGVLYHLPNPVEVIRRLADIAPHVFVWTQCADASSPAGPEEALTHDGRGYRGRKNHLPAAKASIAGYCAGLDAYSIWLYPEDMLNAFVDAGFAHITNVPVPATPQGPAMMFIASKSPLEAPPLPEPIRHILEAAQRDVP